MGTQLDLEVRGFNSYDFAGAAAIGDVNGVSTSALSQLTQNDWEQLYATNFAGKVGINFRTILLQKGFSLKLEGIDLSKLESSAGIIFQGIHFTNCRFPSKMDRPLFDQVTLNHCTFP